MCTNTNAESHVRERTPEEKKSFIEGFNTCLSTMKSDLADDKTLQEVVEHAQAIAALIDSTL